MGFHGGYGTWDMIERYPKVFAAAVPICGGGDETQASLSPRSPFGLPRRQGYGRAGEPLAEHDPGHEGRRRRAEVYRVSEVGHFAWVPPSRPEMLKWLFAQKRR